MACEGVNEHANEESQRVFHCMGISRIFFNQTRHLFTYKRHGLGINIEKKGDRMIGSEWLFFASFFRLSLSVNNEKSMKEYHIMWFFIMRSWVRWGAIRERERMKRKEGEIERKTFKKYCWKKKFTKKKATEMKNW